MFTGIVQACQPVTRVLAKDNLVHFSVQFTEELLRELSPGASVAIDGVCLTVVQIDLDGTVSFDAMDETLERTTLAVVQVGTKVNIERSARIGQEMGGHPVSGHVHTTGVIERVRAAGDNKKVWFALDPVWLKYIFPKGFIAVDGISLTVVDTEADKGLFSVSLIPETVRRTTMGSKANGERVNIEIDQSTRVVVDTIERIHGTR